MKKVESKNLKNKTEGFFPQRRQVMKYIYEAKNIAKRFGIHHERIEVRITENHDCILGQATMNSNKKYIWITEKGLNRSDLRVTVFHEILHTLYNQKHVKGCKLMNDTATTENVSDQEITDIFINYITGGLKNPTQSKEKNRMKKDKGVIWRGTDEHILYLEKQNFLLNQEIERLNGINDCLAEFIKTKTK